MSAGELALLSSFLEEKEKTNALPTQKMCASFDKETQRSVFASRLACNACNLHSEKNVSE